MYPDISYFFHDLFGTDPDNATAVVKTFGMFLFLAFIASGYIFHREILRKEGQGLLQAVDHTLKNTLRSVWQESIFNGLIAFFFAYKIPHVIANFAAFKRDPAAVVFSQGGNIILGLIVGGIAFYYYLQQAKKAMKPEGTVVSFLPSQRVGEMVTYAALFGILGARLFAVSENMSAFYKDPIGTLFSGSGLTVYGGLIVGSLAVIYYLKKNKIAVLPIIDAGAPAMIIGQLVGRLGCQFSGDGDWGGVNAAAKPDWFIFPDWAWSYGYPNNVNRAGEKMADCAYEYCFEMTPGVWPTPIYEVLMYAVVFWILWSLRKKIAIPGIIFCVYLILSSIARFLIEFLRVNDHYDFLGFSGSQAHYISIVFILLGALGIFLLKRNKASV